jgi:hypothetical protein
MKHAWGLVWMSLLFLFALNAVSQAAELDIKQLEAASTYETARGNAGTQPLVCVNDDTRALADKLTQEFKMRQENNKLYEIAILSALALIALFIVLRFITAKSVYSAAHIVNATGLIFIIFGTIMLVIMADTEQQLTAAMGILGAVAGYLFGAINRGKSDSDMRTGE